VPVVPLVPVPDQTGQVVVRRARGRARMVKVGKAAKVLRTRKAHPVAQVVRVPPAVAATAVGHAHSL